MGWVVKHDGSFIQSPNFELGDAACSGTKGVHSYTKINVISATYEQKQCNFYETYELESCGKVADKVAGKNAEITRFFIY